MFEIDILKQNDKCFMLSTFCGSLDQTSFGASYLPHEIKVMYDTSTLRAISTS
jgi:hypothetical protein